MRRLWAKPIPLDMVCPDCHAEIPRGSTEHDCARLRVAIANVFAKGVQALRERPIKPLREIGPFVVWPR